MGLRAALEQVMIIKVGDQGSFAKNLEAFCDKGGASRVERDAISAVLDAGHASSVSTFAAQRRSHLRRAAARHGFENFYIVVERLGDDGLLIESIRPDAMAHEIVAPDVDA